MTLLNDMTLLVLLQKSMLFKHKKHIADSMALSKNDLYHWASHEVILQLLTPALMACWKDTSLFIEQRAWHAVAAFWQQSQPLRELGFEQSSSGWQRTCKLMGIEHDSGHRYRVKIQQVRITLASRRNGGKEKGRLGSRSLSWWLYSPLAPSCFCITPSCISGQVAAEFHRCHFGSPSCEETEQGLPCTHMQINWKRITGLF